ncbi:DUF559 domain-containing protein [Pseudarthrobacter sp. SSS035]|uniref:DUF559 domain-containing protein n=1 Tax=Pseudarthrobacter sp. SSS035 TaxID=2931399 RepID=UPI0020103A39|nr:DUF559 domain-containing protein [Pseudarthrobacter sp. SSS035]
MQSVSTAISKTERQVRDKLLGLGIQVHKGRSGIQCGHEPGRNNFPILTPDILISKTKVCVEVDPAYTHAGKETVDETRNELLAEVGWTVVRLRLGGLKAVGQHDVLVESEAVNNEAITALAAAISDATAGLPGVIRRVEKKQATAARKKFRLGAITEHKYYDNAFHVSWTLDSGAVLRAEAMDSGLYLAIATKWEAPRFIRPLDLHQRPRKEWRSTLHQVLENMDGSDFVRSQLSPGAITCL